MTAWQTQLKSLGDLRAHESMARHTTLGVGGAARWYFRPADRNAVIRTMALIPCDLPLLPLGRGSNLLVADEGFPGLVMDLSCLTALHHEGTVVTAGAGLRMSRLAARCAEWGMAGLEFMATIPGDVGGGVAMNAGAFGQQTSDCLAQLEVVKPGGDTVALDAGALDMGYRRTRLPADALVLSARFILRPDVPETIRERMRKMREKRSSTQPLEQPNCGSVFKNPPGDHAARLIEAAGLKGFRIGGACISGKHANFIVNEGGARSSDVRRLICHARREVEQRFGVRLEPEVRTPGDEA